MEKVCPLIDYPRRPIPGSAEQPRPQARYEGDVVRFYVPLLGALQMRTGDGCDAVSFDKGVPAEG